MDERRSAARPRNNEPPGDQLSNEAAGPKTYSVPQRFGLGTILLGTTFFAVFFAGMKQLDAPVAFIALSASFLACVAFAQMIFQRAPRIASAAIGSAFCLALTAFQFTRLAVGLEPAAFAASAFATTVCGALFGYIAGGLLASMFLVSDSILRTIKRLQSSESRMR
jgi:O-antigen/teichoic acid export membrane protein